MDRQSCLLAVPLPEDFGGRTLEELHVAICRSSCGQSPQ